MDPLSISGIAVGATGLTIQLIQGYGSLSNHFESIKNGPKEIENIQKSLRIVSSVLCSIRDETASVDFDSNLEDALGECNHILRELSIIVNSLVSKSETTDIAPRIWTSFKIKKSKEKIMTFQRRLNDAKVTLMLAHQRPMMQMQRLHYNELSRQSKSIARIEEYVTRKAIQPSSYDREIVTDNADPRAHLEHVMAEIAKIRSLSANSFIKAEFERRVRDIVFDSMSGLTRSNTRSDKVESDSHWPEQLSHGSGMTVTRTQRSTCCFFGKIQCTTEMRYHSDSKDEQRQSSKTTIQFVPALWLIRWGFQYAYALVPDESPIFKLCKDGDLPAVQELFAKGHASVNDVTSWGKTPLHTAAENWHSQLCFYLLRSGADISAIDKSGNSFAYTPFYQIYNDYDYCLFSNKSVSGSHVDRALETIRAFLSAGQDLMENTSEMLRMAGGFDWISQSFLPNGLSIQNSLSVLLVHEILQECSAQRIEFNLEWYCGVFVGVLRLYNSWDLVQYLLEKFPTEAILESVCRWISMDFPYPEYPANVARILRMTGSSNKLRLIHKHVHTLHFWGKSTYWRQPVTPTLAAINCRASFHRFRGALIELKFDMKEFIEEEIQLIGATTGWTISTLDTLFSTSYQPSRPTFPSCKLCGQDEKRQSRYYNKPIWQQWVTRIKEGKDPYAPILIDEFADDSSLREMSVWINHSVCHVCQHKMSHEKRRQKQFEEEQKREEEGSMFLLNIDI